MNPIHHPGRAPAAARVAPVRRPWLIVAAVALLACMSALPQASSAAGLDAADAQALVRRTTERLTIAFSERHEVLRADPVRARALVERIVVPHMALERSARWVLGRHWSTATPGERRRFTGEFRTLLVRTYTTAISEFAEAASAQGTGADEVRAYLDSTITYLPVRSSHGGGDATVPTRVAIPGTSPIRIDYRLRVHDGAWKVFDIRIEGVSLVAVHRGSFGALVKRAGMDGLIERLAAKNRVAAGA